MSKMSAIQKECDFLFISSFETTRRTKKQTKKKAERKLKWLCTNPITTGDIRECVCVYFLRVPFFFLRFFFFTFVSLTLVHYYFKCL